jgi:hypothetical protein
MVNTGAAAERRQTARLIFAASFRFVRRRSLPYIHAMETPTNPDAGNDKLGSSSPPPSGRGPRTLANLTVCEIRTMAQDAGRAAFEAALDTKVGASILVGGKVVRIVRAGNMPVRET